jgi:hypothetical protein
VAMSAATRGREKTLHMDPCPECELLHLDGDSSMNRADKIRWVRTYQVQSSYFTAAIFVDDAGRIFETAPILGRFAGLRIDIFLQIAKNKRWKVEDLTPLAEKIIQ